MESMRIWGHGMLELISFTLGGREYSVEVMSVREIRSIIPMDDRMICFVELNGLIGTIESEAA